LLGQSAEGKGAEKKNGAGGAGDGLPPKAVMSEEERVTN
jgi:hypothetical protein